jgi:hypothetical protein
MTTEFGQQPLADRHDVDTPGTADGPALAKTNILSEGRRHVWSTARQFLHRLLSSALAISALAGVSAHTHDVLAPVHAAICPIAIVAAFDTAVAIGYTLLRWAHSHISITITTPPRT